MPVRLNCNISHTIILKKSEFITELHRVFTLEEIQVVLKDAHKRHPKATHICSAFRIENHERSNDDGGQRGRNDSDVEIFQCLHIPDDAGKQVAGAEIHQTGGGEGFEFFVEPQAQFGEQAEGDVVRDKAFKVTEDGAGDAEEARADGGYAEVCDGDGDGGGGDKPC